MIDSKDLQIHPSERRPFPSSAAAPLARFVRKRRRELGLSLPEAARRAGFSPRQWIRLELGTWIPQRFADRHAIALALGTNSAQISFGALLSEGVARPAAVGGSAGRAWRPHS